MSNVPLSVNGICYAWLGSLGVLALDICHVYYTLKLSVFIPYNMYMSFLNNILNGDLIEFMKFILDGDKMHPHEDLEHIKRKKRHKKHKKHKERRDKEPPVCEIVSKRQNKHLMKKLHEVTRQIQHKISTDVQVNLEDYFTFKPSTTDLDGHVNEEYFEPKMIQIKLDVNRFIDVPKFSLVNHANVDLKQLNCVFRTDAKSLGIPCKENFDIETNAVFEQNMTADGFTKLNELLISEYMHPVTTTDNNPMVGINPTIS